jgi:hypothetical protein
VARATNDDWNRYYEVARRRRRVSGGDPWQQYVAHQTKVEKRYLLIASLAMAALLGLFYFVLMG